MIENYKLPLIKWTIPLLFFLFGLWGCQLPDKPNFQLQQKLQIPILHQKIMFLGGSNAMIDTTKPDLKGYFKTGSNSKVILSTQTAYSSTVNINSLPTIPGNYTFMVNLNYDDPSNGTNILDLYDNKEADILTIPGLDYFAKRIGDFQLLNTKMHFYYKTNLQAGNTVYAAIVGTDPYKGTVYFMPKAGSQYEVTGSPVSGLEAHQQELPDSKLLTFTTNADSTVGDTTYGSIVFDSTNSNVSSFIANLPTTVRFIGKARVNSSKINHSTTSGLFFDSSFGLNVPLNIATSHPVSFTDTLALNLSNLPDSTSKSSLQRGSLTISYQNGIPLGGKVTLTFLNQYKQKITTVPDTTAGIANIIMKAASTDPNTHFVSQPSSGVLAVDFTNQQLKVLNSTRYIIFKADINTTNNQSVKIQMNNYLKLDLTSSFNIDSNVKG